MSEELTIHAYDNQGRELSLRVPSGYWEERTYDAQGRELTYKDAAGYEWACTYDAQGRELTYTNVDGTWHALAAKATFRLRFNPVTGIYWAGCQRLNYADALAYLRGRVDARARLFRKAIKAHHATTPKEPTQ